MAIPTFQTLMYPLLRLLADGRDHDNQDIYERMEAGLDLSEDEKARLLPSGKQRVIVNRMAWAKSYLKQAGLVESPKRGVYRITKRGLEALDRFPHEITFDDLQIYDEFRKFSRKSKRQPAKEKDQRPLEKDEMTPQEHIGYGLSTISDRISRELLAAIKDSSPYFFEKLVVDVLLAMGYGGSQAEAGRVTRRGGDEGIDGVINEDKLGLDVIYIQAKRWKETPVGRPEIQKFVGALHGKRAKKGVYITTSDFTADALEYVRHIEPRVICINGERLAELMIEHGVGVTIEQTLYVKRLDSDYFMEE